MLNTYFKVRYEKYIQEMPSGCIEWIGSKETNGSGLSYGNCWADGKTRRAHRVAYVWGNEIQYEDIDGLDIHHECNNTLCVNVEHLKTVTRKEHCELTPDSIIHDNRLKTHCHRGHEFSGDNVLITSTGARQCRACRRMRYAK